MIDDTSQEFINRHIGPSKKDQEKILDYIGSKSLDQLIQNTVPKNILLKDELKIGDPLSVEERCLDLQYRNRKLENDLKILKKQAGPKGKNTKKDEAAKQAEEAETKHQELIALYNSLEYQRNRKPQYGLGSQQENKTN